MRLKIHSIRLPHFNSAAKERSTEIAVPEKVMISMAQHGGVPCIPLVSPGDTVKTGQLIGDSEARISAPIHSSVTGKVTGITKALNVFGKLHDAVIIETSPEQEISGDIAPPAIGSREDFIEAVKRSGSVGLGGAGFPTHIKFAYDHKTVSIDTLVVNGAECEPYITSDYRTFIEDGEKVADGIRRIMEYLGIKYAVIGIESDKPDAIKKMTELTASDTGISVKALPSAYPQGAEKVLIYNTTGRMVCKGELPSSVGCIVLNCSTVAFISDYLKTGIPLIKRRITIDGNAVKKPVNLIVPIGMLLKDIIDMTEIKQQPDRVLFGGPMMGTAVYEPDTPVIKTINAILMFADTKKYEQTACIKCGRCVSACSMGLVPTDLEYAYDTRNAELMKKLHVEMCMNCGACSYVCPAKRSLSEKNQLSKLYLREIAANKHTKGES